MNYLLCYGYHPWRELADPEAVWEFVQRHGGTIEQLRDTQDFYIPEQPASLLVLRHPGLTRVPALDYII
jgi:hypothetical protein